MKYIIIAFLILFHLSFQSGLRSNYQRIDKAEEDRIINQEEIEDPLIIYSNFTKDIYTSERKVYCVDYYPNNVSDPYYSNLKIKYSFEIRRDKIKDTLCLKISDYHPFIIYDKNCYVSVEYEYKNHIFIRRIDFIIHENNILCFSLTIIYSIIAQAVIYSVVLYKKKTNLTKEEMKNYGLFYIFLCPCSYLYTFLWLVLRWIIVAEITILIALCIYPYSFVGIGIVVGTIHGVLCFYLCGNTHSDDKEDFVYLEIKMKNGNKEEANMIYEEYERIKKENGLIQTNSKKSIFYSDCKSIKILKYQDGVLVEDTPTKSIQVYSSICSCLCCVVFLVVFFAQSVLRKNMFKASKKVVLAIEYHVMIVVVYICLSAVGVGIYSFLSIYYYCKENCKCCNKSSPISPT